MISFEGQGVTETHPNQGNEKNMERRSRIQKKEFDGLCYVNLVDGDMIYGHRRDIAGYAGALTRFDEQLGEFLANMRDDDMLMITADHGCDPGYTGTDHTKRICALSYIRKRDQSRGESAYQKRFCRYGGDDCGSSWK